MEGAYPKYPSKERKYHPLSTLDKMTTWKDQQSTGLSVRVSQLVHLPMLHLLVMRDVPNIEILLITSFLLYIVVIYQITLAIENTKNCRRFCALVICCGPEHIIRTSTLLVNSISDDEMNVRRFAASSLNSSSGQNDY